MLSIIIISYDTAYGEIQFTIEPSAGRLDGYTLYHISGIEYLQGYGFYKWASELRWPVNSMVAGLVLTIDKDDTYAIEFSARKNMDKNTGKLKDSDWIEDILFIYSESDTAMDMLDLDVKGRLNVYRMEKNNLYIIGGFRYQNFSFKASNMIQISLIPELTGSVPGLVAKYKVKYSIPFAGVEFDSKLGDRAILCMAARLGYAVVKDEDDHVLRYKKSTGDSTGHSIDISGSLRFDLSPVVFISLNGEYTRIDADGKQTQTFYATTEEAPAGTTYKDIDLKIKCSQTSVTLGIGVRF